LRLDGLIGVNSLSELKIEKLAIADDKNDLNAELTELKTKPNNRFHNS